MQRERVRDINLNIAIDVKPGNVEFYLINASGLSTSDKEIAIAHEAKGFTFRRINVETDTLGNILNKFAPKEIHFLKIDIEGYEREALSSLDLTMLRPWIICVESTKPMSTETNFDEWEHMITDYNYNLCYNDGLNRFYLSQDHCDLAMHFNYPPGIFDNFTKYSEDASQLKKKIDELTSELEAINLSWCWKIRRILLHIANFHRR